MGAEAVARDERRAIRKAVGAETLAALERTSSELGVLKVDVAHRLGRLQLTLGKPPDDAALNPLWARVGVLSEAICALTDACHSHFARDLHLSRSFLARCRWLLTGQ